MSETAISGDEAVRMILGFDRAAVKLANTQLHKSKTAAKQYQRQASELFIAITGRKPTPAEIDRLVNW